MDVLYNVIVQPSDYSPITLICTVFVEYSILVPLSSNDSDTSKTCHKWYLNGALEHDFIHYKKHTKGINPDYTQKLFLNTLSVCYVIFLSAMDNSSQYEKYFTIKNMNSILLFNAIALYCIVCQCERHLISSLLESEFDMIVCLTF